MLLLIISIPVLFIGPLLWRYLGPNRALRDFGDGFILVSIGGLVLFHILPDSIGDRGWWALAACVLGMLMPMLFHLVGPRESRGANSRLRTFAFAPVLLTALAGVGVHAFLDGMALVHGGRRGDLLAFAVVLHRVSVGLTIWWILRPAFGTAAALCVLVLIALLTPAGYYLGSSIYNHGWFALFQAFMAGSLLHVLYRSRPRGEGTNDGSETGDAASGDSSRLAGWLGALTGLASVIFLDTIGGHGHGHHDQVFFSARFLQWLIAAAPILLCLSIAAIPLGVFLKSETAQPELDIDGKPSMRDPSFKERLLGGLKFGFMELPARVYPWLLVLVFVVTLIDLLPSVGLRALLPAPQELYAAWRLFILGFVVLIFLAILLRRGPRDFLDQITLSRKHG